MVLVIYMPITIISKNNNNVILIKVLYIYYLLYFHKDKKNEMQVLINASSGINIKTLVYKFKQGFNIYYINIGDQKINSSTLKMFKIVLTSF